MGMVKSEFTEYEIGLESMEAGLEWMTRYGVKTFKDYTGEWAVSYTHLPLPTNREV